MSYLDITHAWKGTEYRSSLRKAERATRKAVLLAAMIVVVLGIEINGAEAAGPPYAYGDCDKVSIGVAMADCEVDNYSGKVGVGAIASWGSAAARAQVGTRGDFSYSGYHTISCDINYVAKVYRTAFAFATLHANLFADGVKYTDDFLGADWVFVPWEFPSIRSLWSAPRNRSHRITRSPYLSRGPHTISCGLEARVSGVSLFYPETGAYIAVGDVTRISW